jgi:protein-tyrosine-phosphatase
VDYPASLALESGMKKSVLFVCYGNACRSIMGEALARHHWNDALEVASAGLSALGYVPEETTSVLEEIGVSTNGLYSKGLAEVELDSFDLILDLLEYPLERLMPPSFKGKVIHWHVMDPFSESLEAFRQTRDTIEWLVTEQLPKWVDGE